jgi:hypothetical protein
LNAEQGSLSLALLARRLLLLLHELLWLGTLHLLLLLLLDAL